MVQVEVVKGRKREYRAINPQSAGYAPAPKPAPVPDSAPKRIIHNTWPGHASSRSNSGKRYK